MLFSLLLEIETILLCFFLFFCIIFKSFLAILLLIENTKLLIRLAIRTGKPITVANEAIETRIVVSGKTSKVLSK